MNKKEITKGSSLAKHLSLFEKEIRHVRDYLLNNKLDENSAKHVCEAIVKIRG